MGLYSELPGHNQIDILRKLDFKDFAAFKQCSQETLKVTKNFMHKLLLKATAIEFRDGLILCQLTDNKRKWNLQPVLEEPISLEANIVYVFSPRSKEIVFTEFCEHAQLKARILYLIVHMDPLVLNNLIKVLKVTKLCVSSHKPSFDLINQPELRQLKEIDFMDVEVEESNFLLLEAPRINMSYVKIPSDSLTLSSLNKFFKQWVNGRRRIEKLSIDPFPEDHMEMLKDLEFSINYSSGMVHVLHSYSLSREDGRKLIISIERLRRSPFERLVVVEA